MPPPDARSDQDLVEAANVGDATAFAALYHRYADWVVRLARRLTGHEEDALDVLQETFAYLSRKFPGFLLTASLTTFLYPVVKHCSIAARRKRLRCIGGDELLADLPSDDPPAGTPRAELAAVIACLAPAQREVVLMRFVDGLSLEEIATALAIPLGTVKSRLHNALATLEADPRTRRYYEQS